VGYNGIRDYIIPIYSEYLTQELNNPIPDQLKDILKPKIFE